jgi:hypothetical protein
MAGTGMVQSSKTADYAMGKRFSRQLAWIDSGLVQHHEQL